MARARLRHGVFCHRADEGSILLLSLGCLFVALLLVWMVVDASVVFLDRRALAAGVDGAALAGAQEVDRAALYRTGVAGALPLSPTAVSAAVAQYVAANYPAGQYPGWQIAGASTADGREVTVRGQLRVRLPGFGVVTVVAAATSATQTVGPG